MSVVESAFRPSQGDHFSVIITKQRPKNVICMPKRLDVDRTNWTGFTAATAPTIVNGIVESDIHCFTAAITVAETNHVPRIFCQPFIQNDVRQERRA